MNRFAIEWQVDQAEWEAARRDAREHASGSEHDARRVWLYWHPWGWIQFRQGARLLLPPELIVERLGPTVYIREEDQWIHPTPVDEVHGAHVNIPTVVYYFHLMLEEEQFENAPIGSVTRLYRHDWQIEFTFLKEDSDIVIRSSVFDHIELKVPVSQFFPAVRGLLFDVARAMSDRAPEMLSWDSLDWLKRYSL